MKSQKTLSQKILTLLETNYTVPSIDQNIKLKYTKSLNHNLYVDEPHLDMIQWVTIAFATNVRKSLDTALLMYLASNYTEEELRKLPVSAISHLVDVRFIRDVDGGIGYEIRPRLKPLKYNTGGLHEIH